MRIVPRRKVVIVALIGAGLIGGALWAFDVVGLFGPSYLQRPELAFTPPLKRNTQISVIAVPVAIELAAMRATLDAATPRRFSGKRENPMSGAFGKTDIGWSIGRDSLALAGRPAELTLSAALFGTLRITPARSEAATGSVGLDPERAVQEFMPGAFDTRGVVRGKVTLTARPALLPNWRVDPKLTGRVSIPEGGLSVGGITIDVSGDVKSSVDRTVTEQINVLQAELRKDSMLEETARQQWARMCRSISLAGIAAGNPDLWLEMRPIRAFAAHPIIDANTAIVTLGVEAQSRIVATATKPVCPFPAQLEIVAPVDQGRFAIAVPIDVPFTEINRILNSQLAGRTFPSNADAAAQFKVLSANVAPSGDRLLISLLVNATEQKTWFGLDARATVYIWVRPVLDRAEQKIRLTDMVLDVRSGAAFGLFGIAARIALPYIQQDLDQYAVIDLKPYTASARTGIEAVVADFDKQDDGVNAGANVADLRLAGIEFDSQTLRVVAEAEGTVKITVVGLAPQQEHRP